MLSWLQRNLGTTGNNSIDAMNFFMLILSAIAVPAFLAIFMLTGDYGYIAATFAWLNTCLWVYSMHRAEVKYHRCKPLRIAHKPYAQ